MESPSISIVIPTLNSQRTLELCLKSIAMQDYPHDLLEVIIADGGSTDGTLSMVEDFRATSGIKTNIYENPLKTGEAGKAAGVRVARNELVALIDSDNILPNKQWFLKMAKPLEDPEIFGSEPIEYAYRRGDNHITRYCALMGMNDPLCYFLGNYDRKNHISLSWTDLPIMGVKVTEKAAKQVFGLINYLNNDDEFQYIKVKLQPEVLPTIGANGTILRAKLLKNCLMSEYLFDIDIIYELVSNGYQSFAKVNIGIVHLFGDKMQTFYRKQSRRIRDYIYFKETSIRSYPWQRQSKKRVILFVICCLVLFPLFIQSIRGYMNKPDKVWFLHPIFCWLTLWTYGWGTIASRFYKGTLSRTSWSQ